MRAIMLSLLALSFILASEAAATSSTSGAGSAGVPPHSTQSGSTGGRLSGGGGFGINVPKVKLDETIESEEEEMREETRRGRWTFVDDADPVLSVIRSVRDLFPHIRATCEPTTTLKLRKTFYPLKKTVLTLGADYNTNIGVWQFRSSWEDSIIGGRISVAGRELMLTKSWLVKLLDSEDVATRLKFRAAVNTADWTAYAKFGFRTERIAPLNIKEGFSLKKKLHLDGSRGHAKLEVVARVALPEPEIRFSTDGDTSRGMVAGMGDVQIAFDELNLLLEY